MNEAARQWKDRESLLGESPAMPSRARVAIYCRVSKEDATHNNVSIKMQEARLRDYARAKGWSIVHVYVDQGKSGRNLKRPALARLRDDAKAGKFESVLVFRLDRLVRSVSRLGDMIEEFGKGKVSLVSLSESIDATTSSGRLMINLLGSVAQWERETIAERTAAALAHRRDEGKVYGTVPFGFRRAGAHLDAIKEEIDVVHRIYAMRGEGATLRSIADALASNGIKTKTGKDRWSRESIRRVLTHKKLYRRVLGTF